MLKQSPQAKGDEILEQLTKSVKQGMPDKATQKNYVLNMALEAVEKIILEHTHKLPPHLVKHAPIGYNAERKQFWTEVKQYLLTRKS
jgi:hypothetical protein